MGLDLCLEIGNIFVVGDSRSERIVGWDRHGFSGLGSITQRVLQRDSLSLVGRVSRSSRFRSLVESLDCCDVVE